MKTAGLLIIAAIVVIVLAANAVVVFSAASYSPPEPVIYEGSIQNFYAEHAALLNAAAEMLWAHPEFFDQHRLSGEFDSQFHIHDILQDRRGTNHTMFSDEEWLTIRRLFEATEMTGFCYYYGAPPELTFYLRTTQDGLTSLHYICTEGYMPGQVALELRYYRQFYARFEQLADPRWYAAYPEED